MQGSGKQNSDGSVEFIIHLTKDEFEKFRDSAKAGPEAGEGVTAFFGLGKT